MSRYCSWSMAIIVYNFFWAIAVFCVTWDRYNSEYNIFMNPITYLKIYAYGVVLEVAIYAYLLIVERCFKIPSPSLIDEWLDTVFHAFRLLQFIWHVPGMILFLFWAHKHDIAYLNKNIPFL